jgi:hypothetical protein
MFPRAPRSPLETDTRVDSDGAGRQYRLRQIAGPGELMLRLWEVHPDSRRDRNDVEADQPLTEAGATPTFASVVTFEGPVSQAVKDAGERAERDRITPAMAGHAGSVRMLRLWYPGDRRDFGRRPRHLDRISRGGRPQDQFHDAARRRGCRVAAGP